MRKIIKLLLHFFAFFYSVHLAEKWRMMCDIVYTQISIKKFAAVGSNPFIHKPLHLKGGKYVRIGDRFYAGYRTRIEAVHEYAGQKFTPEIIIGNNVCFNYDCHVGAINRIEIGDNVLIGSRVLITDHNHGDVSPQSLQLPPALRPLISNGAVKIEQNVWIGEGVAILGGVTIGKNSIIAANSVVTHSIGDNCVAAGVPAKVIKNIQF